MLAMLWLGYAAARVALGTVGKPLWYSFLSRQAQRNAWTCSLQA
jgi:hypothetical protein